MFTSSMYRGMNPVFENYNMFRENYFEPLFMCMLSGVVWDRSTLDTQFVRFL